jgi:hypothetical protein
LLKKSPEIEAEDNQEITRINRKLGISGVFKGSNSLIQTKKKAPPK